MAKRLVGHDRPEIGSADTDVDDVADAFAGCPKPAAFADGSCEGGHAVENLMHQGDNVVAINNDLGRLWVTEGGVQNRALLGDVDLFTTEHLVDVRFEVSFIGEGEEQRQGLIGQALLGVIKVDALRVDRHRHSAIGIGGEEIAKVRLRIGRCVVGEGTPFRRLRNQGHNWSSFHVPLDADVSAQL